MSQSGHKRSFEKVTIKRQRVLMCTKWWGCLSLCSKIHFLLFFEWITIHKSFNGFGGIGMKIKFFAPILILALGLITTAEGLAQEQISEICRAINNNSGPSEQKYRAALMDLSEFFAGERIVVSSGAPFDGTPTQTELSIDITEIVDTDGFPGTVSYQFLVDESVRVGWEVSGPVYPNVTWTIDCYPDELPTLTPTPIPTLNWQGLALLVMLLMGFTHYRRRKIIS